MDRLERFAARQKRPILLSISPGVKHGRSDAVRLRFRGADRAQLHSAANEKSTSEFVACAELGGYTVVRSPLDHFPMAGTPFDEINGRRRTTAIASKATP